MTLREAIDEKHAKRALALVEAECRGGAVVDLLRAEARAGHARRRLDAQAGAPAAVREALRISLEEEMANFNECRRAAKAWGVV